MSRVPFCLHSCVYFSFPYYSFSTPLHSIRCRPLILFPVVVSSPVLSSFPGVCCFLFVFVLRQTRREREFFFPSPTRERRAQFSKFYLGTLMHSVLFPFSERRGRSVFHFFLFFFLLLAQSCNRRHQESWRIEKTADRETNNNKISTRLSKAMWKLRERCRSVFLSQPQEQQQLEFSASFFFLLLLHLPSEARVIFGKQSCVVPGLSFHAAYVCGMCFCASECLSVYMRFLGCCCCCICHRWLPPFPSPFFSFPCCLMSCLLFVCLDAMFASESPAGWEMRCISPFSLSCRPCELSCMFFVVNGKIRPFLPHVCESGRTSTKVLLCCAVWLKCRHTRKGMCYSSRLTTRKVQEEESSWAKKRRQKTKNKFIAPSTELLPFHCTIHRAVTFVVLRPNFWCSPPIRT